MVKGDPIKIRLDPLIQERYEAEAQALGLPFSTYLRQRLEKSDAVLAELWALRKAVEAIASRPAAAAKAAPATGGGGADAGMLLEMLLLLRQLASPQKVQVARAEVERQGLPVWRGGGAGE